jgi:hypothetical protein
VIGCFIAKYSSEVIFFGFNSLSHNSQLIVVGSVKFHLLRTSLKQLENAAFPFSSKSSGWNKIPFSLLIPSM